MDALLGVLLIVCGGFLMLAGVAWVFAAILKVVNRDAAPPPLTDVQRERILAELMGEYRRQQRESERRAEMSRIARERGEG